MVADWFDPGVGGHQMGDNDPDTAGGRIYRVAPTGSTAVAPKLDFSSAAGAAAALASPNMAARYLAWTKLHELGAQAEGDLVKMWKGGNPRLRARAFWLLSKLPEKGAAYIAAAAKDADSDIRITALRAASEIKLDIIPLVKDLVKDPSAQVRRECALRLRHSASMDAPGLWSELAVAHDGKDRWYLEALGIGADKNEDAFFSAWLAKVGESGWDTPAGRDIVWRSRSNKALPYLVKILKGAKMPAPEEQHYMRAFDFHTGPAKDEALKSLLE
jgi:hypothetical protein